MKINGRTRISTNYRLHGIIFFFIIGIATLHLNFCLENIQFILLPLLIATMFGFSLPTYQKCLDGGEQLDACTKWQGWSFSFRHFNKLGIKRQTKLTSSQLYLQPILMGFFIMRLRNILAEKDCVLLSTNLGCSLAFFM